MTPTQREIHERNQQRFSESASGGYFSEHRSKQGRLFQVFGHRKELRGTYSVAMVVDRCDGAINGWTRKELARYHGFSPITLLSDLPDEELIRDVVLDLRKQESYEDAALLREVAEAMVAAFNVLAVSGL